MLLAYVAEPLIRRTKGFFLVIGATAEEWFNKDAVYVTAGERYRLTTAKETTEAIRRQRIRAVRQAAVHLLPALRQAELWSLDEHTNVGERI